MGTCRIILDTNILKGTTAREPYHPLNREFVDNLIKFINDQKLGTNIQIVIPNIVIDEIVYQILKDIDKHMETLSKLNDNFSKIGIDGIQLNKYNNFDFEEYLRKIVSEYAKLNNIIILEYPSVSLKELMERNGKNLLPFNKSEKNGDKGFKDTLIWLSVLEDSKKNNADNYIFVTDDSIFYNTAFIVQLSKEFLNYTNSGEIKFFNNVADVKEYLDEYFSTKLYLKQFNEKVEKVINDNISIIINRINELKYKWAILDDIPNNVTNLKLVNIIPLSKNSAEVDFEIDANNYTTTLSSINNLWNAGSTYGLTGSLCYPTITDPSTVILKKPPKNFKIGIKLVITDMGTEVKFDIKNVIDLSFKNLFYTNYSINNVY